MKKEKPSIKKEQKNLQDTEFAVTIQKLEEYLQIIPDENARFSILKNLLRFVIGASNVNVVKAIGLLAIIQKELMEDLQHTQEQNNPKEPYDKKMGYIG